jgi:membrane protein
VTDSGRSAVEVEQIVARAPSRIRPAVNWVMGTWLGRSLLRIATGFVRLEMFDRSMTMAAQVFTSVFPILIMAAVFLSSRYGTAIADAIEVPEETEIVLQDALANTGASTFGVIGTLVVLISATSLSRALTRAFAAIWNLRRPKTGVVLAWRWLGVVLIVAGYVVLVRWLTSAVEGLAATDFWSWLVPLTLDTAMATLVPYLLLSGQLSARRLLPGAFVFGLIMVALRPASSAFLPHALDVSSDRYGTIGVAFTYIAWLYVLSFCFLGAALIGEVISTDDGRLGRLIRGPAVASTPIPVSPSEAPGPTSRG